MDYEKAYKEALGRAKKLYDQGTITESLSYCFPELAESEDELTRIDLLEYVKHCVCYRDVCKEEKDKWIAWLEKRGEQKPVIPDDALREGIAHFGITQYQIDNWLKKYVNVEKQGEQKPINKVEPKFEIEKGKWYVCNTSRYTDFIVGEAYYCPENGMLKPNENAIARYVARDCFHLWTLRDAKDGDVLATSAGAFIYNGNNGGGSCPGCYCGINTLGRFKVGVEHHWTGKKVYPATKEQRDIIFAKMHEAGYEFDVEKKELKKIEQKSEKPKWSDDDEQYLLVCKNALSKYQVSNKWDADIISKWLDDKLKQREQKPTWSEEDEKMVKDIIAAIDTLYPHGMVNWLKSLKYRVQPQLKYEWDEEDNKRIDRIYDFLWKHKRGFSAIIWQIEEDANWLKSLKNKVALQKQWKPSKEQIIALRWVLNNIPYNKHKEEISGLLDQIKDL